MSKKPAFQFYPGDWRKDQNLSRASLQAKGALIEILCLAFECEKRGYLKTGKHPWSVDEIAYAMGGDKSVNVAAIEELLALKVLKKDRKHTIFSARMVRDEKISKVRRDAGFKGGNPNLVKQEVKQIPTPSVSVSPSSSTSINSYTDPFFEYFKFHTNGIPDLVLQNEVAKFRNKYPEKSDPKKCSRLLQTWASNIEWKPEALVKKMVM